MAATLPARPLYLGGRFVEGEARAALVRAPWDGQPLAEVAQASWGQLDEALAVAHRARAELALRNTGARRQLCEAISRGLAARAEEIAQVICAEAGKPITYARDEVARAVWTFALAADAATAASGQLVPVDLTPAATGYQAIARRVPSGVVVGISPFNFPLNLAAHKVAPALAVGAPIVLKPPPQAPSAALLLAEIAQAAGAPPAALQVLPCENQLAERLAGDPRAAVVSFTGSARVGWGLKTKVGRARLVLELGGNAAAIVCEDADLAWAVERVAVGGYAYAGQVCISVQRIFVQRALAPRFLEALRARVAQFAVADPADPETVVGPLIDGAAADRLTTWLTEAQVGGAHIEGGARQGNRLSAAIVLNAPAESRIVREEAFGPVVVVEPYDDFDQLLGRVNDSDYGLQTGLFTQDLRRVRRAWDVLEVGGLVINDAPTFRSDAMPYGGVKGSGLGREGVAWAMAELCEPRVLVLGR